MLQAGIEPRSENDLDVRNMNSEEIIEKVGGFGRYQKWQYFYFCILWVSCGAQALLPVFILYVPRYRCSIPGLSNDTFQVQNEAQAAYLNETVPLEEINGHMIYSHCHLYERNNHSSSSVHPENSTANSTTPFPVETCHKWVYDDSVVLKTAATQMNFVCSKTYLVSTTNTLYMAGLLVGSFFGGILSDRKGRKPVIMIGITLNLLSGLLLYFVNHAILLGICRFLTGISANLLFSTCFILSLEMVDSSRLSVIGLHSQNMFALGEVLATGICFYVPGWHLQSLVLALIFLPTVGFYFVVSESARWLVSRGQYAEAENVIFKMARMNRRDVERMNRVIKEQNSLKKGDAEQPIRNDYVWKWLKSRTLLARTLILGLNWAAISLVYHGLIFNVSNLSGNLYMNSLVSALVEFPAYTFLMFTMDRWGRKPLFSTSMILSGLCLILSYIMPKDKQLLSVIFAMLGKLTISAAFGIVFNFTSELLPTVIRNAGLGLNSFIGKLVALAAPLISQAGSLFGTEFATVFPLIIFGTMTVLGGILSLFLPETRGQPLPETIEDGENIQNCKRPKMKKNCTYSVNKGMTTDE